MICQLLILIVSIFSYCDSHEELYPQEKFDGTYLHTTNHRQRPPSNESFAKRRRSTQALNRQMDLVNRDDLYSRYFRFVNESLPIKVEIVNNNPNSARKWNFLSMLAL